jgi:uncharacterized protein YndB with AHSA1/START domain
MSHEPVSVSRVVAAPPAAVFAILADPRRHPELDGSGMLQASTDGPARLSPGAEFSIAMKQFGMPYTMTNVVTEFEDGARIAWQPWARVAGRRTLGGVTWRYELSPSGPGTLVTETYDVTTGRGSRILAALGYPAKMEKAMSATLDRLAVAVETLPAPDPPSVPDLGTAPLP